MTNSSVMGDNTSPVFIGGLMKSGTSLLRKLIASHPRIFGGLETFWFSEDFVKNWKETEAKRIKWFIKFYNITEKEYFEYVDKANDAYHFFDLLMDYLTKRAYKNRWVEKTPDNAKHIDLIFKKWPTSKFIYVSRDLRDCYASWKKNKKYNLSRFSKDLNIIEAQLLCFWNDDRLLHVKYEDLVTDTENVLKEVFTFLNEEYIQGLEQYSGDDSDYKKVKNVTGKESSTAVSLSKPIFTSSIGQYNEILEEGEVSLIESKFQSYKRLVS